MKLLVTGGTGFIGAPLVQALVKDGNEVSVITRNPERASTQAGLCYLPWNESGWESILGECDAIVNLSGEPLMSKRWNQAQKRRIWESRIKTTQRLLDAIGKSPSKPAVLINASAVGFYGSCGESALSETDPVGCGFLAELCQAWETEAQCAERFGLRVVRLRIGMVLAKGGGAISKMLPPFRYFLGGPLGQGSQWVSWIHREDLIELVKWSLKRSTICGALNATAPKPVTMGEFCRALGRALRRPCWLQVPACALRVMLGEMAGVLLSGQKVFPAAALKGGFAFRYPGLDQALTECLRA